MKNRNHQRTPSYPPQPRRRHKRIPRVRYVGHLIPIDPVTLEVLPLPARFEISDGRIVHGEATAVMICNPTGHIYEPAGA